MFEWLQLLQHRAHERGQRLERLVLPGEIFAALLTDLPGVPSVMRVYYPGMASIIVYGPSFATKVVREDSIGPFHLEVGEKGN
jgi:hypothetical protein